MQRNKYVYVVELSDEIRSKPKFAEANPDSDPTKPFLYVGRTGHTPEERLKNHKEGHKSSRFVKANGLSLRPDFYEHLNPMSYRESVKQEKELANKLRQEGYAVWQN
jgi:hypothetical protein